MNLVLFILAASLALVGCKVRFVVDVVRQGIHTPRQNSPIFPEISWDKFDELTSGGARQLYLLGRLRRFKYIETEQFLPAAYDPSKIYARSIDSRRSMMATQSYLLGLYPYGLAQLNDNQDKHTRDWLAPAVNLTIAEEAIKVLGKNTFPKGIPVIPIETVSDTVEKLLKPSDCPYYNALYDGYFNTDRYKKLLKEVHWKTWLDVMDQYPTLNESYLSIGNNAEFMADFFIISELAGKKPKKLTKDIMTNLKNFSCAVIKDFLISDPMLIKIGLNVLTKEVLNYMNATIEGRNINGLKFVAYTVQRRTIGELLLGIGSFNKSFSWTIDDFAANILFELNGPEDSKTESDYTVNLYYNGDLIHSEPYSSFKVNLEATGNLQKNREDVCKKPRLPFPVTEVD